MGSTGPILDLDAVCEMLGITIYGAPLGADLDNALSGAFAYHPDAGVSILVNLDMRYFPVSSPTALVRLRQMNAITADTYQNLRHSVSPVSLARSLGYVVDPEEYNPDPGRWRIHRFPRPFLRMLRHAVVNTEAMSPPTAASFAGLGIPDIVSVLDRPTACGADEPPHLQTEFNEFEDGVSDRIRKPVRYQLDGLLQPATVHR